MTFRTFAFSLLTSVFFVPLAHAEQPDFADLPSDHYAYNAVKFLRVNNIISGYDDNTFRPNKAVNRAEAIKLIVAPLVTSDQIAAAKKAKTAYSDIPQEVWYQPYVAIARISKVIDGPPKKTAFNGTNTVLKAEFMKMVQTAFGADPLASYSEITLPIATDVKDASAWFYPYMRYALATSMVSVNASGELHPGKQLTRGEVAVMLYRFILYKEHRRNQALLSLAETDIANVTNLLNSGFFDDAGYASARALLYSRGALTSRPTDDIIKGAVKIAESFRSLVHAYKAFAGQMFDDAIKHAGDAWNLSARGKEFSAELSSITEKVQGIAKQLADQSRVAKEQAPEGGIGNLQLKDPSSAPTPAPQPEPAVDENFLKIGN